MRALVAALAVAVLVVPGGSAAAAAPSGALLKSGTSLYPRSIRLAHSGAANGRIIASGAEKYKVTVFGS